MVISRPPLYIYIYVQPGQGPPPCLVDYVLQVQEHVGGVTYLLHGRVADPYLGAEVYTAPSYQPGFAPHPRDPGFYKPSFLLCTPRVLTTHFCV